MNSVKLDRKAGVPLYAQIRDAIRGQVKNQILRPGDRLPAVAELGRQLEVTASTVRRAFRDLLKSGHITSHVGRGTFVSDPSRAPETREAAPSPAKSSPVASIDPALSQAARRLRMGVAQNLEALMGVTAKPGLIRFTHGIPAAYTVQEGLLEKLIAQAMERGQSAYEGYCRATGLPDLRQAVANHLSQAGAEVSPEQILITSGSQQAISLLAQSALEGNWRIFCEVPCYSGVFKAFGAVGHWVESVPRDAEGPSTERLEDLGSERPAMLYLCPELHNPTGADLSPFRRQALIEWAHNTNALLVADEIFHDLRFEGSAPRSLLDGKGAERAVTIGSLSKSFMCGLRIGWLVSTPQRIRSLLDLKNAVDLGCPPLMQGIAEALLRSGEYESHLQRVRELYRVRRDATLEALTKHMPEAVTWTRPLGGFQMWVELPAGYSSLTLFLLAVERGVAFVPGPLHDVDHRFVNGFRMCYEALEPEQIVSGVKLLAGAVEELLSHPPTDPGLSGVGNIM